VKYKQRCKANFESTITMYDHMQLKFGVHRLSEDVEGDLKTLLYWGPKLISYHRVKYIRSAVLAPRNCSHLT